MKERTVNFPRWQYSRPAPMERAKGLLAGKLRLLGVKALVHDPSVK